ncbi:MAG: glycosyltransferase family 4 protein [Propioniciclava sp.]|uniref:glycosyltransferase family 4 protein n=1 Tax=Propioniciclava sp. TaxID=2038686 RepID=UPI0039E52361
MRVLVYPHTLEIGGSQLNAIELAAGVRDLGHEVAVFGRPGDLLERIGQLGLEFIEAPPQGKRPSLPTAAALTRLARERGFDVFHGYEWPPILDSVLASHRCGAATVGTVMSMSVPPFIPSNTPLVVGTKEIEDAERHRSLVTTIEPPVDLSFNDIDADPGRQEFRSRYGLDDGKVAVVSVSRLAHELKLEGLLTAIEVIGDLAATLPVRLVVVGDGPARAEVEDAAARVNARAGAGTIVLVGRLDDPRPAYAAADISIGMGGSALRALAYGKPLIVQGERGFWRTLTPETLDQFLWTGWYGIGEGSAHGAQTLAGELRPLLAQQERRASLGAFGLRTVRERFSLTRASERQLELYERACAAPRGWGNAGPELAALARYTSYFVDKRVRRAIGRERTDDFNSRTVTARNRDKKGARR